MHPAEHVSTTCDLLLAFAFLKQRYRLKVEQLGDSLGLALGSENVL